MDWAAPLEAVTVALVFALLFGAGIAPWLGYASRLHLDSNIIFACLSRAAGSFLTNAVPYC
jgi:hypothetical protein